MICTLCSWREDPKQQALLSLGPVLFLQHQDATPKGTGIIIPVRRAETVCGLTAEESAATLAWLRDVKAWMDDAYHLTAIPWAGIAAQSADKTSCMAICM
jgi:hypothetical protein